jgi:hypothetical protein
LRLRKDFHSRKNALFYRAPNGAAVGDLFMIPAAAITPDAVKPAVNRNQGNVKAGGSASDKRTAAITLITKSNDGSR